MNPRTIAPIATLVTLAAFFGCKSKPASEPEPAAASEPEAAESEAATSGAEGDPDEVSAAPDAGATRGSAGLLAAASHVLETMTSSRYSHKTHVEGGNYEVDCSGFVDYLLARTDPEALGELRAATVRRPLAKHFVQFLEMSTAKLSWQRVRRVQELEPGDIVAWLKPAELTSTNTGHVMIVKAKPEAVAAGRWSIAVIDSSGAKHGKSDSRLRAHTTGVGTGIIQLETDASGAPIAYRWSDRRSSPSRTTTIALGRVL